MLQRYRLLEHSCFVLASFAVPQAELLEALEEEQKQQESKKVSKKKKKAAVKGADKADAVDSPCLSASPEPPVHPVCTKCAMLQGPQKVSKRGKACTSCVGCKPGDRPSKQPPVAQASKPGTDAVRGVQSAHGHALHSAASHSPGHGLQHLSSSSSSDQSSGTSIHHSSGSNSPLEPGTPGSMTSQQTNDGWEVQQRSKRASSAVVEKQALDSSHSVASQPRACRTVLAPHPALSAAWQCAPGSHTHKPHMKDVLVHNVQWSPSSTDSLHLASGPVLFQPPPPPPPPRTRVTASAAPVSTDNVIAKPHSVVAVNAWNVDGKGAVASQTLAMTRNAWTSAVHQVNAVTFYIVLSGDCHS